MTVFSTGNLCNRFLPALVVVAFSFLSKVIHINLAFRKRFTECVEVPDSCNMDGITLLL